MTEERKDAESPKFTRRSFLDFMIGGGLFVWGAAMIAPVISYVWPISTGGIKKNTISAGPVKDFGVGLAKFVQSEGKPIMVIRIAEDKYKAFSAICTHLGCIVKWDAESKNILCPCHAGVFSTDGKVVAGPPPRPLSEYEVAVIGGEVTVKL